MKSADVIVVGTGAAGLFHALFLPQDYKVIMITKKEVEDSDSFLAQGGISALKNKDDFDSYFEDTMKAGHYENDKDAVEKMIEESPGIIDDLIAFGVQFDKKDGEIEFTREGGHSTFRILHHEDMTGREITSHLYEEVKKRSNITIMTHCTMLDVIEKDGECKGVIYKDEQGNVSSLFAPNTVLATGGLGGLFKNSTNFRHLTADSLAICLRHNIELKNINYIQIHPTTFYSKKPGRRFLISESVRGEGAYLLNKDGERFTDELKPRDVVTGEIRKQMKKDGTDHVYLSVTHLDGDRIKQRFPNIYRQCLEEGYDMTKDWIPVTPAQHYFMGGIKVDLNSKTTMEHLYAVGETSCNGVHGKNRLASNSLLEALVFAKAAAKDIQKNPAHMDMDIYVDYEKYSQEEQLMKENQRLVLDEIKRKDRSFYDQWCNDGN
ncbi:MULTISPECIES: L-aspartate oxidase [Anaerostipes]|uniref:L-aspartate oxidase n=1 Tax=Anaerostipes TaxID=207244 RepID=UPI00095293B8|nr:MULTISPECIES: L-aspartate oxidase [Anaerostipes]MCI5622793.1 L-aspartate oxidase [Anaerostipes sp.]MDY2726714.1 L-aspartate oxidase [Anaerostipes faecalis]OLR59688.1 L-aspartate oxidase [Anaerostipes sp. 494a]